MPGLYRIPLVEGCKPVNQKLRRIHLDVLVKAKIEKQKLKSNGTPIF
jgi:hypothetical protein